MYAAYRNHAGVAQLLLEAGADITVQNEDDMTAMELAVGQGNAAGSFLAPSDLMLKAFKFHCCFPSVCSYKF